MKEQQIHALMNYLDDGYLIFASNKLARRVELLLWDNGIRVDKIFYISQGNHRYLSPRYPQE